MIDLQEMATDLAQRGLIVDIETPTWSGTIAGQPEWGDSPIVVLPVSMLSAFWKLRRSLEQNLIDHSIDCSGGRFIPDMSINSWRKNHDELKARFDLAKTTVLSARDGMVEIARSTASANFISSWKIVHPNESAPPSGAIHAASLAGSMVPTVEGLRDKYLVLKRVTRHSYSCSSHEAVSLILDEGEKRFAAWETIDELIAGNIRELNHSLTSCFNSYHKGKRIELALKGSHRFVRTDMLPSIGMSDKVKTLLRIIDGVSNDEINGEEFESALKSVICFAEKASTVADVLKLMQYSSAET